MAIYTIGWDVTPFDGGHCDAPLYPSERYRKVHERTRWAASYMSTFGLHVHVGAESSDHAVDLIHGAAPYLAHLLALSASSPFAAGKDTGLASSRVTVFESMPTTGTPPPLANWAEFERLVDQLTRCQAIESLKDLLWDIRPSPKYGTVEVRMCDGLPSLKETLGLVAAVKCLFRWLDQRWRRGETFSPVPNWRLRENKWRAARWGMEANLVNDNCGVRSVRQDWHDLVEEWRSFGEDCDRVRELLAKPPSYERQRQIYQESGSLRTVVQELAADWKAGVRD